MFLYSIFQTLIEETEELITQAVPLGLRGGSKRGLTAAMERDVFVSLLLGGEVESDADLDDVPASVVRYREPNGELLTTWVVDYYQ